MSPIDTPDTDDVTVTIPIFPLEGVLLLPGGDLPLNIFEPRYLAMVRDAMGADRLIGVIQPCACQEKMPEGARPFYEIGCMGRISTFEETKDGRYLINLHGLMRFRVQEHRLHEKGYRVAVVHVRDYIRDFEKPQPLPDCLTRPDLVEKLRPYMQREGLSLDWDLASRVADERFYTLLAMVCPFAPVEKQALLEAATFEDRCRLLKCLLDLSCAEDMTNCPEQPC